MDHDIQDKELVTRSPGNILTNMKQLKGFSSANFISSFQPILDIMKANNVYLARFGFKLNSTTTNDKIAEIFRAFEAAQPVSSISSLAIDCGGSQTDLSIVSQNLTNLCNNLANLTDLEITCFSARHDPTINLIDVLQNLKLLKNLHFNTLLFTNEDIPDDAFHNKTSTVTTGRLESISFCCAVFM